MPRIKFKLGELLNAIRLNDGLITHAAKKLNISYQTICHRLKTNALKIKKSNNVYYFDSDN